MNEAQAMLVRDKILEYGCRLLAGGEPDFKPGTFVPKNREADELIKKEPLAFLLAVIMDQGARAEPIWEIPYHIKGKLGSLDPYRIASIHDPNSLFAELRRKPRYPQKSAKWITAACQRITNQYGRKAENLWKGNPKAGDVALRLSEFDGIGQKKSSMAVNILYRDLGVPLSNINEIDVSYDVNVRRVFARAGLSYNESEYAVILAARRLCPDYPGVLDLPSWTIGRKWCKARELKCSDCCLSGVCLKRI